MARRHLPVVQSPLDSLKYVFREVDRGVEGSLKHAATMGHRVPCKAGCAACCSDIAVVAQYEIVPIIERIRAMSPATRQRILERAVAWREKYVAAGLAEDDHEPDMQRYHNAKLTCPLLDVVRQKCMVYADRPFACRLHYVINMEPSACANRANEPVVTALIFDHYGKQALTYVAQASAGGKEGQVIFAWDHLTLMLLRAWDLVRDQTKSYVKWLNEVVEGGQYESGVHAAVPEVEDEEHEDLSEDGHDPGHDRT